MHNIHINKWYDKVVHCIPYTVDTIKAMVIFSFPFCPFENHMELFLSESHSNGVREYGLELFRLFIISILWQLIEGRFQQRNSADRSMIIKSLIGMALWNAHSFLSIIYELFLSHQPLP